MRQVEDLDHQIIDVWLKNAAQMKHDIFHWLLHYTNNVTIDVQPNLPKQIQVFHKALTALPGAIS